MTKYVNNFLIDLGRIEKFEVVSVNETVTVKDLTFKNMHTYWKSVTTGELYLPFNDPDINLNSDYDRYRAEKKLLSTKDIINIRKKYKLSLRSFAKVLGIGYSTLSKIENGALQSNEHDALLRLASDSYSFYNNLVLPKAELLTDKELKELSKVIEKLIVVSYKEHEIIAGNVLSKTNEMITTINIFNYDIKESERRFEKEDSEWQLENSILKKFIQPHWIQ
ncbi:helix-turn-helix domain-containing protein [Ligilactobacillus salivarius]|uniref:helix-turn-helix domain-containing protein n=1 Tax=Ligilactobacillus salivarius TaxID=1624 RepID=UPI0006688B7F|nr:helix-turn-helix domain-containing protein [Ligilactobacillus salivarius]